MCPFVNTSVVVSDLWESWGPEGLCFMQPQPAKPLSPTSQGVLMPCLSLASCGDSVKFRISKKWRLLGITVGLGASLCPQILSSLFV